MKDLRNHIPLNASCKAVAAFCALLILSFLGVLTACRKPEPPPQPGPPVLIVSAAASLTDAMQDVETAYHQEHPEVEIHNNFGSSGTLAQQIEDGAPVDVFVSAASRPMDELDSRGLLVADSRHNLLGNILVLIAPRSSKINGFQQLTEPSVKTIALGDPASVPAGQYGQQMLTALHLYDDVKSKLVLAKDVRQVLTYVESGNADAGIVYATDAQTSTAVRVVAAAPEWTHDPIVYPVAAIAKGHHTGAARQFVDFLQSVPAKAIFVKRGFNIAVQ